jgi:divalent metal cation (Fe/Co/Zn/Cd) transporter
MYMSRASRIVALIIAIAFVVVGVLFMVQRIGAVIGWDKASSGWPVIVLLVGLILLIAFLIYKSVRNKLNR